jgi:hypothetical protein
MRFLDRELNAERLAASGIYCAIGSFADILPISKHFSSRRRRRHSSAISFK